MADLILVADDDSNLRQLVCEEISEAGYKVLGAPNGEEAVKLLKRHPVDAVVTDLKMPGSDGLMLLDEVKHHDVEIPVILLIQSYSEVSLEDVYDRGVEAVFEKPVDLESLLKVISEGIKKKGTPFATRPERFDVEFEVEFGFSGLKDAIRSRTINFGRGGMFLALEGAYPEVGDRFGFKLIFDTKTDKTIEGQCVVRWVRSITKNGLPSGIGVEFSALTADAANAVCELSNKIKTKSFIPRA